MLKQPLGIMSAESGMTADGLTGRRVPWSGAVTALRALIGSCVLIGSANPVSAEILAIESCLEARVSALADGEVVSTDTSLELFPATAPELPLTAFAALGDLADSTATNTNGTAALAEFRDPTLSTESNPAELGVEIECLSTASDQQFDAVAAVVEDRSITLSAEELALESDENDRLVRSSIFLEGALLIWSREPTADLSGLSINLDWRVLQTSNPIDIGTPGCGFMITSSGTSLGTSGSEFGPQTDVAFSASVSVAGLPDGAINVSQSGMLTLAIGDAALLGDSAEVRDLVDDLLAAGTLQLVIIAPQQFDYLYPAEADVPFTLQSLLRVSAANLPDGTIAAAVVGRPFTNLADVLAPVLQDGRGLRLQQAINDAVRGSGSRGDGPAAPGFGGSGVCGLFGAEVLGAGLFLSLRRGRSTRRTGRIRAEGE